MAAAATMVNLAKHHRLAHRLTDEYDLESAVLSDIMNEEKICLDRWFSGASYVVKKWACYLAYLAYASVFISLEILHTTYIDEHLTINMTYKPIISFVIFYSEWLVASIIFHIIVRMNSSLFFYDMEEIIKCAQTMKSSSKFVFSVLSATLAFAAFLLALFHDNLNHGKGKFFISLLLLIACICLAWIIEIIRAQWVLQRAVASKKSGG